uniref:CSON005013 protein n=1 Tax=Culicoides sonorensis TaxID=179676 RepID=A0A336LY72_CULSO
MKSFSWVLFKYCGVFPFNIKNAQQKFIISRSWRIWSVFVILLTLIISFKRLQVYYNVTPDPHDADFIYNFIFQASPSLEIAEILLASYSMQWTSSMRKISKCFQKVNFFASNHFTRKLSSIVVIYITMLIVLLWCNVYLIVNAVGDFTLQLDYVTDFIQTVLRSMHFMLIHEIMELINLNLIKSEIKLRDLNINDNFNQIIHDLTNTVEAYKEFSSLFQWIIKFHSIQCFYEVLLGLNRFECVLFESTHGTVFGLSAINIFWWCFQCPIQFLIICKVDAFMNKVQSLSDLTEKFYMKYKDPKVLSMRFHINFNYKSFKFTITKRAIFEFGCKIGSYYMIIMQFSDLVLNEKK